MDAICTWGSLDKDSYLSTVIREVIDPRSWTTIRISHDDRVCSEFKDKQFDGNEFFYILHFLKNAS